jgi:hypothetical protein
MPTKIVNMDQTPPSYLDEAEVPRSTLNRGFAADSKNANLNLGTTLDFDVNNKVVSNAVHSKLLRDIRRYYAVDGSN